MNHSEYADHVAGVLAPWFEIEREVTGRTVRATAEGEFKPHRVRADLLLRPKGDFMPDGYYVVEIKRNGDKVQEAIQQCADYANSIFHGQPPVMGFVTMPCFQDFMRDIGRRYPSRFRLWRDGQHDAEKIHKLMEREKKGGSETLTYLLHRSSLWGAMMVARKLNVGGFTEKQGSWCFWLEADGDSTNAFLVTKRAEWPRPLRAENAYWQGGISRRIGSIKHRTESAA